MNPEPIWDWPSSVQFLGRYRVEGESSKFRNSVGYITAMNALQCNAMATDAIMAKHSGCDHRPVSVHGFQHGHGCSDSAVGAGRGTESAGGAAGCAVAA